MIPMATLSDGIAVKSNTVRGVLIFMQVGLKALIAERGLIKSWFHLGLIKLVGIEEGRIQENKRNLLRTCFRHKK
jgi:hypothetical protein